MEQYYNHLFIYLIFTLISFGACGYSFQSTYQSWEAGPHGQKFLSNLRNFKEHHLNQGGAPRDNFNSLPHRQQMEGILSSRNPVTVSRPVGHNLGSLWLPDSDQKSHPYLLDLYYTSRWDPPSDEPVHHTTPNMPINDLRTVIKEPLYEIEEEMPTWHLPDRRTSPLEASTSSAFPLDASTSSRFLNDSVLSNHNRHLNGQDANQWWARAHQPTAAPADSFLEPPRFGNPDSHPYHDSLHNTSDVNEMDRDGRGSGLGLGLGFRGGIANTTYMEQEEDEEDLGLAFTDDDTGRAEGSAHRSDGDISSVQRVSLPVRIIPRSNDPV